MSSNEELMGSGAHAEEVKLGERFEFGKNWTQFLALLTEERIAAAESSLRRMLAVETLQGQTFLDVGSGSGLFSLVARRLGARVRSFDFDPDSVACTAELRRRYYPEDAAWQVAEGSALDCAYLRSLGQYDIVYAWGVLHHTGSMWQALDNVHRLVKPAGKLFIAIYNDQGSRSRRWHLAKRTYCQLPKLLKNPWALLTIAPGEFKVAVAAMLTGRVGAYLKTWTQVDPTRGMNHWRDIVDWVGGYPYEYAAPDEIFAFYQKRGFTLVNLKCKGVGLGCAEYVFVAPGA